MQDVNMYQESDLNEIIDMLESHGYGKEKLYLENLLETIHSMEEKIAKTDAALMKLAAQIFQLQDTIERSMIVDSANNLFSTVEKAKRGLARIKRGLSAEASKIIASVQNGSKEVLGTAIAKLRVPQCLRAIQKICQKCEMAAMKGNETLSTIRNELYAVNTHIRNAGKVNNRETPSKS